jgi:hypothetical protein
MTQSSLHASPRAFRRTGAKRETLLLLAEFFCLLTNDLVELRHGDLTKSHQRTMRRTLQLLAKENRVHRIRYMNPKQERGLTHAHGLTDKGVKFVTEQLEYFGQPKTFDEHSERTLDHELEISYFHIALKKLCEENHLTLYWQQKDLKCAVNPDAYFAITDSGKPEGKNTFHYFLEIERAKLGSWKNGEPQIIRKLAKYYDYYNTDDCEKEWANFRQFRVILVQRTEERRNNLCKAFVEKHRHRMFWLTTEPLYRQNIAGEIFLTPKDGQAKSYSFPNIF